MLRNRAAIAVKLEESDIDPHRLPSVLTSAQAWTERLQSGADAPAALGELTERAVLSREGVRLSLKLPVAPAEPGDELKQARLSLTNFILLQMKRRGVEMRMVLEGDSTPARRDLPLLKAVARVRRWAADLVSGRVESVGELARREGLDGRSVRRLVQLGFLAPRIVATIAEGRQPVELTVKALTRRGALPLLWKAQHQALGIQ